MSESIKEAGPRAPSWDFFFGFSEGPNAYLAQGPKSGWGAEPTHSTSYHIRTATTGEVRALCLWKLWFYLERGRGEREILRSERYMAPLKRKKKDISFFLLRICGEGGEKHVKEILRRRRRRKFFPFFLLDLVHLSQKKRKKIDHLQPTTPPHPLSLQWRLLPLLGSEAG